MKIGKKKKNREMDHCGIKRTKLTEQSNYVQILLCAGSLDEYICKSGHTLNRQFTHFPKNICSLNYF